MIVEGLRFRGTEWDMQAAGAGSSVRSVLNSHQRKTLIRGDSKYPEFAA